MSSAGESGIGLPEPVLRHLRRRFDVQGTLGRGGSALVLKALHRELGKPVALKVISLGAEGDELVLERAEFEGRSQGALKHPNLVEVHETERVGDHFLLVCELVEGGTLLDYMQENRPLPFRTVIDRMIEIARGLEAIHAAGVVHRDLKSCNVLLDAQRRAKITDFGLASGPGRRRKTLSGTILGTFEYMAPEQVQGVACDQRADLYSLGVIGYELMAGELPFTASNPKDLLQKIMRDTPRPLIHHRGDTPTWYSHLIEEQLLAKKPDDRPADVTEVLKHLQRSGSGEVSKSTQPIPSSIASSPRLVPTQAMESSRDVKLVDTRPRKVNRPPPARGGVTFLISVALCAGALLAFFTGRGGVTLRQVKLQLNQQQGRLEVQVDASDPLVLSFQDTTGNSLRDPISVVARETTGISFTLPPSSGGVNLRLTTGETVLVDMPIPRLARFPTLQTFEELVLFSVKEGLGTWTARFQALREDLMRDVTGDRPDDRIVFRQEPFPDEWRQVRLVRLTGQGTLPAPVGTTSPPVPCEVVLEPDVSTYTLKGLSSLVPGLLEKAHGGRPVPLTWEEAGPIFFPGGSGGSFDEARSHFEKLFDSGAISPEGKVRTYQWLAGMQRVAAGSMHDGRLAVLPLEELQRGLVYHQNRELDGKFEIPTTRLHGFLPSEMASHRKSSREGREARSMDGLDNIMGGQMTVIEPFFNEKNGILSPPRGCPPPLRQFKDLRLWGASHSLELPRSPWPPPDGWVTFEAVVLNLRRNYVLTLRIEGDKQKALEVPIINTQDRWNVAHPGEGFDRTVSDRSWKNIPATGRRYVVRIRSTALPRGAPVKVRLDYDPNPHARPKAATAALLGYRWEPE